MGKNLSEKLLESTACWTAAVRTAESKREDRLFDDPWAEALAGEAGAAWLAARPATGRQLRALDTASDPDKYGKYAAQLAGDGEERIALLDFMAGYNVATSK